MDKELKRKIRVAKAFVEKLNPEECAQIFAGFRDRDLVQAIRAMRMRFTPEQLAELDQLFQPPNSAIKEESHG